VSDTALATLACAGDVEALAGLVERLRPSLYAAAIGYLRNRDDALDVVQETAVVALTRLPSLRDPAAAPGWLHAVLRNLCLMRLRRPDREVPLGPVAATFAAADSADRPDELLDRHAQRDWLWATLDTLAPEDRLTVMLRYFTRCRSYQAIAAVTGVPVGTVRSRLHRSRSQLAEALERTVAGSPLSRDDLERSRRAEWEDLYARVHQAPVARTYRDPTRPT
jgi:RNA polymerase sigma-70 factor (ECF subfamily)